MEIDIKNIKAAYEKATESEKTLLSTLFPDLSLGQTDKTEDKRPVTERIKSFDDACYEQGLDPEAVEEDWDAIGLKPDEVAYHKLRIICTALNEGWTPQFTEEEWRWFPWHYLWSGSELDKKSDEWKADRHLIMIGDKYQSEYAGLACATSYSTPSDAGACIGSRLCLKSEALATYCGKQFIDLWADYLLTRK